MAEDNVSLTGYSGYSTNYQDLNIDIYKLELREIVKVILTLEGYNIQLEDQIFGDEVEDGAISKINLRITERNG